MISNKNLVYFSLLFLLVSISFTLLYKSIVLSSVIFFTLNNYFTINFVFPNQLTFFNKIWYFFGLF